MLQIILSCVIIALQIAVIVLQALNLHNWNVYWSFFEEPEGDDYEMWEERDVDD